MQDYLVKFETITVGAHAFALRSLLDRQQFSANDTAATDAGIYSGTWALFGVFWPAGIILANLMDDYPLVPGMRILEVGCGLALSSIVLQKRGANITASDFHPMVADFLVQNLLLNDLPAILFHASDWSAGNPDLGEFDLIIGSDILYEPAHPAMLTAFIAQHSGKHTRIMIIDPNRQQQSAFTKNMLASGFHCTSTPVIGALADTLGFKGKLLSYQKTAG